MESRGVASISALASITVIPLVQTGDSSRRRVPGRSGPEFVWKFQTGGKRATANIKLSERLIVEPPPVRRQRLGVNHDQSG